MVRRGTAPDSLDSCLFRMAQEAGVSFRFGERLPPGRADIVANGPVGHPFAIAAGVTFRCSSTLASVILDDALAPGGYAYLLAADGSATLASVLFSRFSEARKCLASAVAVFTELHALEPFDQPAYWGGYGCYAPLRPGSRPLCLGEGAGFQDFLFGFGIRNAMMSGILAARSIVESVDYSRLCDARLGPFVQASIVNRAVYEILGDTAKRALPFAVGATRHPNRVMGALYRWTWFHRMLSPFVRGLRLTRDVAAPEDVMPTLSG
jgi:hypothetical protein